jgi:formamidopyrimidine-DNA glycosylase
MEYYFVNWGFIMIEIPEAISLSKQLNDTIKGKTISKVVGGHIKHKFTWFYGDIDKYLKLMVNNRIDKAESFGGFVEITAGSNKILFSEGVNLRFFEGSSEIPDKHQLLIEFTDGSYLCASIQMYGGVGCFEKDTLENEYYLGAKQKPSPLSDDFNKDYFDRLISSIENARKLSVKAFLATEQRIPGLGDGVLQDILYNARVHHKQKINTLSEEQKKDIFNSIKKTLKEMTDKNGRNTEKDLFSNTGGYITKVSKNTVGKNCKVCNSKIEKASYMGGSIYFCSGCQKI